MLETTAPAGCLGRTSEWVVVSVDVPDLDDDGLGVELSQAIAELRAALLRSWWDGHRGLLRFRIEPVELTLQVAVTRTGKGSAGIKWHVLTLGAERAKEAVATQTLVLRLAPVLLDAEEKPRPDSEQLISDLEDDRREPLPEPSAAEPE